jgi:hypothetical protein
MPSKSTVRRAKRDLAEGKRPSTAAGEFVKEEIEHVREGRHGVRSPRQAIAIGLSEARRAGVPLPPPRRGRVSARARRAAALDYATGQGRRKPRAASRRRRRATARVLQRERRRTASPKALARQARRAASRRSARERSRAAKRAAVTRRRRTRASKPRPAATRRRG